MTVFRSLLFVPGVQERMLARAPTVGADALILDLEASVPSTEKARARAMVAAAVPRLTAATAAPVFVRLNTLASGLTEEDLAAVAQPGLAGVVLPAVRSPAELRRLDRWLGRAEARAGMTPGALRILVMIETAQGVMRCLSILSASRRVAAGLFGAEDFRQDMGIPRTPERREVRHARAMVAMAARAAGVHAVDMVFTDLDDMAGLAAETREGRLLGYRGKQVIHPRQVAAVHAALAPHDDDVAWAQRVLVAAADAAAQGIGAFTLDGTMIDEPVIVQARQILAWREEQHGRAASPDASATHARGDQ